MKKELVRGLETNPFKGHHQFLRYFCGWTWVSLGLSCLGFGDLLESVDLYLSANLDIFSHYFFKVLWFFSAFHRLFFFFAAPHGLQDLPQPGIKPRPPQ